MHDLVNCIIVHAFNTQAATAATHFQIEAGGSGNSDSTVSCRPDFQLLLYPLITMEEPNTHPASRKSLLGTKYSPEDLKTFSNEKQVTANTPPAFIAHAKDDTVVVSANSELYLKALVANSVAAKYVELPSGNHGQFIICMSMCTRVIVLLYNNPSPTVQQQYPYPQSHCR